MKLMVHIKHQQYPSYSIRGNGASGGEGPYGPPAGNGYCPNLLIGGKNGHHVPTGGGDDGPLDEPYGTGPESSSSCELE